MPSEFGLVEPFDVTDEDLEGCSKREAYFRGTEWEFVCNRSRAKSAAFTQWVRRVNAPPILRMLRRHGRTAEVTREDVSHVLISVGKKDVS